MIIKNTLKKCSLSTRSCPGKLFPAPNQTNKLRRRAPTPMRCCRTSWASEISMKITATPSLSRRSKHSRKTRTWQAELAPNFSISKTSTTARAVHDRDLTRKITKTRPKSSRAPKGRFTRTTRTSTSRIKTKRVAWILMLFKRRKTFREGIAWRRTTVLMRSETIRRSTDHISHNTPRTFNDSIKISKFRYKMRVGLLPIRWQKLWMRLKFRSTRTARAKRRGRSRRIWSRVRDSTARVLPRCSKWTPTLQTFSGTTSQFKKTTPRGRRGLPTNTPITSRTSSICKSISWRPKDQS